MPRRPRLRELAAAAAVALGAAACGGGGDVLEDSSRALDDVRSGVMTLRVTLTPRGGAGDNPFGFELKGPFVTGETPRAQFTYTQIANGSEGVAHVVLEGDGGYIETAGTRQPLTTAQVEQLRGATDAAASGGGIRLDEWATTRDERDCGDNVCVSGELDPAKAIDGIARLQQSVAPSTPVDTDESLEEAVRTSRYELVAGKDDVPRRVSMTIDFEKQVPAKLQRTLGRYVGAKLEFDFRLARANEDVLG